MICSRCGSYHDREGRDLCFRCHISGISFGFHGSAQHGRKGWNRTAREFREENFGTSSEKELAARGIERAPR